MSQQSRSLAKLPERVVFVLPASPTLGCGDNLSRQRERSVKIKLKIKKTYFENKSNTILKIKDLAAKIK